MTERERVVRTLPSPVRRAAVTALYVSLALVFTVVIERASVSETCVGVRDCTVWEQTWLAALAVAWACTAIVTATFGWQGRLPGARAT